MLLIIRFTRWNWFSTKRAAWFHRSLLSWGKFQCKPATKCFDWSFAPKLKSDDWFARQKRFGPPSEFLLTSSCSSLVQHLSGPIM